ncbi:MAG: hypothetical protein IKW03_02090 [Clostridia bacterium]|nr:hypothetical protein [Clostridia bacterium]
MIDITIDRNRISSFFKAEINVTSDVPFTSIEARATKTGSAFGRRTGICLLRDDVTLSDGVVNLPSAVNEYSFDAECAEIQTDGEYRISVFVLTEDGKWNDGSVFLSLSGETVVDSDGALIFVKRDGSGTDETYRSAYSGNDYNSFISEVLL